MSLLLIAVMLYTGNSLLLDKLSGVMMSKQVHKETLMSDLWHIPCSQYHPTDEQSTLWLCLIRGIRSIWMSNI